LLANLTASHLNSLFQSLRPLRAGCFAIFPFACGTFLYFSLNAFSFGKTSLASSIVICSELGFTGEQSSAYTSNLILESTLSANEFKNVGRISQVLACEKL
jgi:hypothetical protein